MYTTGMENCCKAYELGNFDDEDDTSVNGLVKRIKEEIDDTGNINNARVFFATTVSDQVNAIAALKIVGFVSTTRGVKLNDGNILRGWMKNVTAKKLPKHDPNNHQPW